MILNAKHIPGFLFLLLGLWAGITGCKKDTDGANIDGPGSMTVSSISNSSGSGGSVIFLQGSGLGSVRSIIFSNDSVPASFNPTFNSDKAVIFRVPDTALGGLQNIILTNSTGKQVVVPYTVIAKPTVTTAYPVDFQAGSTITLTGSNFEDVDSVYAQGDSTHLATIVSKDHHNLVLTMPSISISNVSLVIHNAYGKTVPSTSFLNLDGSDSNAPFLFFTDNFGPVIGNWSWCTTAVSTAYSVVGTSSLLATYSLNSWGAISLYCGTPVTCANYSYLTFYVKGGTASEQINVASENGGSTSTITVPASVWTYFKLPVSSFLSGVTLTRLDFQIQGPTDAQQTLYFDDIALVK